jgi:hypothetical protein
MKMICVPVLCLAAITINNCGLNGINGSGVSKTESRAVAAFSKIDLSGSPEVEVTVGPETSVSITADDNILPLIETTVSGNTLSIDSKSSYSTHIGVKVKITAPTLEGVSVSGSGDIRVTGLKSDAMEAGITGSGNVDLRGVVDRFKAHITGSGDLKAGELSAKHVNVTVTGSGDATIRAAEELDATVTGSGDIHYAGNPAEVRKHVTGSGDINAK